MDMVTGVQEKTSYSMSMVGSELRSLKSLSETHADPSPAPNNRGHQQAQDSQIQSSSSIREQVSKAQRDLDDSLMGLGGGEFSHGRNDGGQGLNDGDYAAPPWSPQTSGIDDRHRQASGRPGGDDHDQF